MARPQSNFICSVEGCNEKAHAKGWCRRHWARMHLYGRLEKIKGEIKGCCTVEGCTNPIKGKGLCNNHYQRQRKYGRTEKIKKPSKTIHPFYMMWFERKQNKNLCTEWLDFWTFVNDVGERPASNFVLIKLNDEFVYGPSNFKWHETLIKELNETDKDWHARKWEDRRVRNPDVEYDRNLKRNFGISLEQYLEKSENQNHKCMICEETDSRIGKSGRVNRLAVDHCHKTNKIRDLLCWRCYALLGKVNESVELLQKMIDYLNKHKGEQ